jgi:hypothetical protein
LSTKPRKSIIQWALHPTFILNSSSIAGFTIIFYNSLAIAGLDHPAPRLYGQMDSRFIPRGEKPSYARAAEEEVALKTDFKVFGKKSFYLQHRLCSELRSMGENLTLPPPAELLRESFGDRKPPDITRKITACVACRKQKVCPNLILFN